MEKTERIALSEFVLGGATTEAENVLADRTRFELPEADWNTFVEFLDRPLQDKPRLGRLMAEPSVLDE